MKLTSRILFMTMLFLSVSAFSHAQEKQWKKLHEQTNRLYQKGLYTEALKVGWEALDVAEKTFGTAHPNVGSSLNNLAAILSRSTSELCLLFSTSPTLNPFRFCGRGAKTIFSLSGIMVGSKISSDMVLLSKIFEFAKKSNSS